MKLRLEDCGPSQNRSGFLRLEEISDKQVFTLRDSFPFPVLWCSLKVETGNLTGLVFGGFFVLSLVLNR